MDHETPQQTTERAIFDVLRRIETGELTVTPAGDPKNFAFGNLDYAVSNGWTLTLFIDADAWDFIDSVKDSEGNLFDYDDMSLELQDYGPPDDVVARVYGIGNANVDQLGVPRGPVPDTYPKTGDAAVDFMEGARRMAVSAATTLNNLYRQRLLDRK